MNIFKHPNISDKPFLYFRQNLPKLKYSPPNTFFQKQILDSYIDCLNDPNSELIIIANSLLDPVLEQLKESVQPKLPLIISKLGQG